MVDVESDGPVPGVHSMVSFGAVIVEEGLSNTFYGQLQPISDIWIPEALAVSGHSREETLTFDDPVDVMTKFANWIKKHENGKRPVFWSDNNGYDFAFISYYFHVYYGSNPFGWSSQNLNSFYKGISRDMTASFKRYRKTKHTHHPVDDAMGCAEALLAIVDIYDVQTRQLMRK